VRKVIVHGGIELLGEDTEVQNLNLEKLPTDPHDRRMGNVWINEADKRIAYVENEANPELIRKLIHDGDLAALKETIDLKDNRLDTYLTVKNITTNDMMFGQPVYSLNNLEAGFANANDINKKKVIGLVSDNIIESNGTSGCVLTSGLLTGTIAQWEYVTGMIGGLVPDTKYFLDTVSGKLTLYPPTDSGQFICLLGSALTTTIFLIRIERPITI